MPKYYEDELELFYLLSWLLFIELLGLASLPLLFSTSRPLPVGSMSIARVAGLIGITWLSFVYFRTTGLPPTATSLRLVCALYLLLGVIVWLKQKRRVVPGINKDVVWASLLYALGLGLGIVHTFLAPDIAGSERPMDMSYLTYFVRGGSLPPTDPWAAGLSTQYYYLGYYLLAQLHLILGTDPAYGYHFSHIVLPALSLPLLYSIARLLIRGPLISTVITMLSYSVAVFETYRVFFTYQPRKAFWAYISLSRILPERIILETPLWGYLYGDLHPYIIVFPIELLIIALIVCLLYVCPGNIVVAGFLGMAFGLLPGLQAWSVFPLFWILLFGLLTFLYKEFRRLSLSELIRAHGSWLSVFLVFAVVPAVFLLQDLSGGSGAKTFRLVTSERYSFSIFFRALGHLVVPFSIAGILVLDRKWDERGMPLWRGVLLTSAIALILSAGVYTVTCLAFAAALCTGVLGAVSIQLLGRNERLLAVAGVFGLSTFAMLVLWESVVVVHRSPFIARSASVLHPIMCMAFLLLLLYWCRSLQVRLTRTIGYTLFTGVLILLSLSSGFMVYLGLKNPRFANPSYTFNGLSFLSENDDYALIYWLRKNAPRDAALIEAVERQYSSGARFGTYSGVSTVMGWASHVGLRGVSKAETQRRIGEIETIYSSLEPGEAWEAARRVEATYIAIGELEQKRYPAEALEKFSTAPELFELVLESGSSRLYFIQPNTPK